MDYFSKSIFSRNVCICCCFLEWVFGAQLFDKQLSIHYGSNNVNQCHQNDAKCRRHFGSHPRPRHPALSPGLLSRLCRAVVFFNTLVRSLTPAMSGFFDPALLLEALSSPFGLLNASARLEKFRPYLRCQKWTVLTAIGHIVAPPS